MKPVCTSPASLSNDQLFTALLEKSTDERQLTIETIALLQEVERRLLHLEKGYGSLLEFCVKDLKYPESTAYRHISTMWATKEIPQIKKAIEDGSLNLNTVTQAQTFFRQERKYRDKVYTKTEKLSIFRELANKTKAEAEKILIAKSPELPKPEYLRKVTETETRITLTIEQTLLDRLDEIKSKFSHINPNPSYAELIRLMADEILLRKKVLLEKSLEKISEKLIANESPAVNKRSRFIPAAIRHFVHMRDGGACTFTDPKTNRRCGSKFKLEVDHITPFSLGGSNDPENLRLACRNHNQFFWEKKEYRQSRP